jgi:anaerobic dimethyl sulfoxide reductase subunit A
MSPPGNSEPSDRIVTSTCSYDCGARCLLQVHVSDGVVQKITPDDQPGPALRACARGLAQREVLYAKDRLLQPLEPVAEHQQRGQGPEEAGIDRCA